MVMLLHQINNNFNVQNVQQDFMLIFLLVNVYHVIHIVINVFNILNHIILQK